MSSFRVSAGGAAFSVTEVPADTIVPSPQYSLQAQVGTKSESPLIRLPLLWPHLGNSLRPQPTQFTSLVLNSFKS